MEASTTVTPPPFVGAVVHYIEPSPKPSDPPVDQAAIVLVAEGSQVCLKVMTAGGDHVKHSVSCASPAERKPYTWHWPEEAK